MKRIIFPIFFFCSALLLGQNLKLDTNSIKIGEQITLSISCDFEEEEQIVWPIFSNSIITGIEIIEMGEIDSTKNKNSISLSQEFTITAWDSGSYYIAPIVFSENKKTEGINLNVQTIDLGENTEIKDIKPPMKAPYGWSDIWPFLQGILLIILSYFLFKRYVFAKKKTVIKSKPKIINPADVIALNDLAILKDKELWQEGKLKQYHSEISEIIRAYLEERFQILALELPTSDTLKNLGNKGIATEDLQILATILQRADLAKFAKSKPTELENEQSMEQSVIFVNNTKKREKKNV